MSLSWLHPICVLKPSCPHGDMHNLPGYRRKCFEELWANQKQGFWSADWGPALSANHMAEFVVRWQIRPAHSVLKQMKTKANEAVSHPASCIVARGTERSCRAPGNKTGFIITTATSVFLCVCLHVVKRKTYKIKVEDSNKEWKENSELCLKFWRLIPVSKTFCLLVLTLWKRSKKKLLEATSLKVTSSRLLTSGLNRQCEEEPWFCNYMNYFSPHINQEADPGWLLIVFQQK